jgi:CubicO group peptidase (beta-lactamase class C family)
MRGATALALPGAPAAAQPAGAEPLEPILAPLRTAHGLPALAAAVVREGQIVAAGATGTRRAGTDIPVTVSDRFHIGSDTKAMTATLAGIEVEAGRLGWDSTVGALFPEASASLDPGFRAVTLAQFLSHTSGLPSDDAAFLDLILRALGPEPGDDLNLDELRAWMLAQWGRRPLAAAPGARFAYANMNYVIAGAMIERSAGRSWEELIVERIFTPLGLASAGLGPQSSPGRVDAPLGHARRSDGTLKPMLAGPNADVPATLAPAGAVHLSVLDFAAWAGWNAGLGRRGPPLITPATLRLLQTPRIAMSPRAGGPAAPGGYGFGWGVVEEQFARGPIVTHTGSNTLNLAMVMTQPAQDFALVMATNCAGPPADAALRALAATLFARYG